MSDSPKGAHVKTRFCPSPTGLMHLGNTRTALFNDLLARHAGGTFLLRIEDTDKERSDDRYTQALMEDLTWLGLTWHEGPDEDKGLGPYHQSKRQAIYDDYYQRLTDSGLVYPCFCSEEELALTRKVQRSQGKPPRYPGTCRSLPEEQVNERLASGEKPTLRFRVPDDDVIEFEDLVRGKQSFHSKDIGDFIVRRANGTPPFMYCNAIDDALMEVTFALRGEDHLTNTPRQIMILKALSLPVPTYGHIALIVGPDGSPLSKRHGSKSVQALREAGYLPIAINNYLARIGHYYGHDDYLTLDQLAQQFRVAALAKSPAKFNEEQLLYWQKEAVMRLDEESLWAWLGDEIKACVPDASRQAFLMLVKPNIRFPADALHWANVIFDRELVMNADKTAILKTAGSDFFRIAVSALDQFGPDLKAITNHIKETTGIKGKALFQPLRIAITGEDHGPELAKILLMMDQQEIKRRMEIAA